MSMSACFPDRLTLPVAVHQPLSEDPEMAYTALLRAKYATRCTQIRCLQSRFLRQHVLWTKMLVNYYRCMMWCRIHWIMVEYDVGSGDLWRNEGNHISHSVVMICGVSLILWPLRPTRAWEEETLITHIPPLFVICLDSYTRIVDRCSHSRASMTLTGIEGIWYDISRNPIRTISSMKVSTTRDITQKLFLYDSVSNGSIVRPLLPEQFPHQLEQAGSLPVFAKRFPQLSRPILIRTFRAWYVKYTAFHAASFGRLEYSIWLKLSKRLSKYSQFRSENDGFAPLHAEFWGYQKLQAAQMMHHGKPHISHTKLYIVWLVLVDLIGQFASKIVDVWCGVPLAT